MRMAISLTAQALVLLLVGAAGAAGQDARWTPWLGCWTPTGTSRQSQDVRICVVPTTAGDGVRMITFAGEQTMLDESIMADGARQTTTENDCTFARTSRWASRAPRLLTLTERQCAGQPAQQGSGLSMLTGTNEWLDLQVVGTGGREVVRTRRYTRSTDAPPAAIADIVRTLPAPVAVAAVRPAVDDVIEATQVVSSRAVEAWLIETEPQMAIDRRALLKLTDAHVAEPVIDLLVALAYPERFDVQRPASTSGGGAIGLTGDEFLSPWQTWAGPWSLDPYSFSYSPFLPWGAFDLYSFYTPYDQGGYVLVGGGAPLPIAASHGQVVNGQGYTRVQPHAEVVTRDGNRSGSSSAGADSGGGSSTTAGASSAGYSSGGGGATGLTAVPR